MEFNFSYLYIFGFIYMAINIFYTMFFSYVCIRKDISYFIFLKRFISERWFVAIPISFFIAFAYLDFGYNYFYAGVNGVISVLGVLFFLGIFGLYVYVVINIFNFVKSMLDK